MTGFLCVLAIIGASPSARLTVDQIVERALDTDAWGLGDTEVVAHANVQSAHGSTRRLDFSAKSSLYARPLSKSLIRFSAPGDLAGTGLLQIQNKDADDDRFLFLPELKRSRRISGATRNGAFMGTDFTYADIDRRDLRNSTRKLLGEEDVGKMACYHLEALPSGGESAYARIELWVRKDNFVPLKMLMYNRAGAVAKKLTVEEMRRLSGRWFITRSVMSTEGESSSTELVLDKITPRHDFSDKDFTVSSLEKL